jgi:glycosyltransferase involved in cell wall biosynthesis
MVPKTYRELKTLIKREKSEVAYLESGRNGIMTPDNLDAYVSAVQNLLSKEQLRKEMSLACREDAQRYSLDKMVDNFCEGIVKALDVKPLPKQ